MPQAPQVWSPFKHFVPSAVPLASSARGTTPLTLSAFAASWVSTYCLRAACEGAVGSPGRFSGPVIASPVLATNEPEPTAETDWSTYALFAASLPSCGTGTLGGAENCFTPAMVSCPARWTTPESAALADTALSTYCRDATCSATLEGTTVERTVAMFTGVDEDGITHVSLSVVPSSSLSTTL